MGTINKPLPPVRNRGQDIRESLKQPVKKEQGDVPKLAKEDEEALAKARRDGTPMPDYYKAWDKLAAAIDEEEHEAVDTNKIQMEADRQFSQQEMMQRTSGARPNTEIVVKGARRSRLSIADEFKTQGNSYFVSLEYSKAIECYTRCLMSFDSNKDEPSLKTITLS